MSENDENEANLLLVEAAYHDRSDFHLKDVFLIIRAGFVVPQARSKRHSQDLR